MSWIHYFLLAIVLLFVFQGIYYLFNKKIYTFRNPLLPAVIAVFFASIVTCIESYFI
ncbi:hypothetical protein BA73_03078 [Acinetobacter baumannii R1B]|jgi:hypothetical protein|nr:hypothetical protein F905_02489 [Acinetobacter sp. CIP 53.82]EZF17314.1 hypothetical protein BA73_03078 [Acinetobacter baumannii R1B]KZA47373.1 hypothetical protein LV45_03195 [Acinetobacter baumannii]